jgi:hypothetical protein
MVTDLRLGHARVFTYPDCCCFPQVVVSSVVEDALNFNGTPAAKIDSHIKLVILAYMIWPKFHDIEFGRVGERKQNKNVW